MKNWPALILAPSLALTNLAVTYALVTPSCSRQSPVALNVVAALILLVCAFVTLQAWRNFAGQGSVADDEPRDAVRLRPRFIALVATMVGALSCLVVLAQWFPHWVLSPCAN